MTDNPGQKDMAGPILFLDSGVGGLTILRAVRARLPQAPLVYCADSAGYPYGTKSEAEITTRVPALLGRLVERVRPAAIVIACNTASTIALAHVRAALDVPVIGTVPAIKPAAERSKTRVIGVLGTESTVRQPYVSDLSRRFAADCTVLRYGAPRLVAAAEATLRGTPPDPGTIRFALDGLRRQPGAERMDMVVLACTHFPLLLDELQREAPALRFIDGADGIARHTAHILEGAVWPATPPAGRILFTGGLAGTDALRPALAGFGLTEILAL